ncbi:MAG: hypothetical protein KDB07_09345 [Planctomycetes bacterium]|nr:hypothetical protein [Planctomycetota bacterium]
MSSISIRRAALQAEEVQATTPPRPSRKGEALAFALAALVVAAVKLGLLEKVPF